MKTEDGQDVHIDLLGVFGRFRSRCGMLAQTREWLEHHTSDPRYSADAKFEEELERLNRYARAWWEDYKNDWWRTLTPGPPDRLTCPIFPRPNPKPPGEEQEV